MSELKVIHLLGRLYPSGMERMLASAAQDFAEQGIRSIVIGQGEGHPFRDDLANAGYDVRVVPSLRTLAGCFALSRIVSAERPDVVHIHTESAFLPAVLSSYLSARTRVVRTVHSVFRPHGKAAVSRRVQAMLADRFVAQFVAPSPDVAKNELNWNRKLQVIYNWVSSDYIAAKRHSGSNASPLHAILVGNCASVKNHEFALKHLMAKGYVVSHHGNEAHATALEREMLESLASQGRLRYRGSEPPLQSLKNGGVFVLPSLHEGMSVALAEAIAVGTPCLVADSIGLSWAKGIQGVEHISLLEEDAWSSALRETGYLPVAGGSAPPDLSPRRGAEEYAELYRTVANHIRSGRGAIGRRV